MANASEPRVIFGLDPGLATTGYGVIRAARNALLAQRVGVITTVPGQPDAQRLHRLQRELRALLRDIRPQLVAVEKIFFNTNTTTAMAVSQARGAVLAVCGDLGLPVVECTPLQVKLAVAGYGRASKLQLQRMVTVWLNLKELPRPDDAADALAVAIWGARVGESRIKN